MYKPPKPQNELDRLAELESLAILDTPNEQLFDDITRFAAQIMDCPISLVSLVDENRQWFKSKIGLDATQTERDVSFCGHAILSDEIFIIEDTRKDSRFQNNPLYQEDPHISFYAGVPLKTRENIRIGTLCVIDTKPKVISEDQKKTLIFLAGQVVSLLKERQKLIEQNKIQQNFEDIQDLTLSGAWQLDVKTLSTSWSKGIYDIYGLPYGLETNKISGLSFYAEHERERLSTLIDRCIRNHEPFDDIFEFYDNQKTKKWVRSNGRPVINQNGEISQIIGTIQDVTALQLKEQDKTLILDHISEGYFDWNIPQDYEYMSPRFWEILGYDPSTKKHHPSEWQKIIHPIDLERAQAQYQTHIQSGGKIPFNLEVRYLDFAGNYRWILCSSQVIEWSEDGQAIRIVGTHRDIHQQKMSNIEAQLIKQGLDTYAIVARTDEHGLITYVNDLFCNISKYSEHELLGQNHRLLNSGHHPSSFFTEMWNTIQSKKTWRGEIKNRASDGSFYWVDTTIIPTLDINQEISGFMAFRYDITDRKNNELALKNSENKHRQLFMQSKDAVMLLSSPTWQFSDCNPETLKLFQISSAEQFKSLGPWDISPTRQPCGRESGDMAKEYIQMAIDQGSAFFEWVHQNSKGDSIFCTVLLSKIQENDNTYLQATVRDITEQKKLSREIQKTKKYLELALEGANLGIWDWNLETNEVQYNEQWARLRGLEIQDLKMNLKDWESRVHPEDLEHAYQNIQNYLNGQTTYFEHIHRVQHQDGRWISILGRGRFSEWDNEGKPIRFTGTDMDISELIANQKKVELFFNKAPFGFAFCHLDQKFIETNTGFSSLTGFSQSEILTMTFWDLIVNPDEKLQLDWESKLLNGCDYGPFQAHCRTKDGPLIPITLNSFLVKDYDGIQGIWTIIKDTSKEKALEEEKQALLKQTISLNMRLQTIFDFAPVVVFECLNDTNWTMTYLNSAIKNLIGYSSKEIIDKNQISFANIIHPADRDIVANSVHQSNQEDASYSITYRLIDKNGQIKWVWEQGTQIQNGKKLTGVMIDITERKKREYMTQLLSDIRSQYITLNTDKKKFFDHLLQKTLDITQSEYGFIGELLEDSNGKYLKTYAISDISWDAATKAFYHEHAPQGMEFRNLKTLFGLVITDHQIVLTNDPQKHPNSGGLPPGHPEMRSFLGVPLKYNLESIAMIGLANRKGGYSESDTTELNPFFEAIGEMIHTLQLNENLESQKLISAHQSKLASVGQLAAGVGHEINNPLAIIQGQLEMMRRHFEKNDLLDNTIEERLIKSHRNIDRISQIVKGLRAFTHFDNLVQESFNLSQQVNETVNMLRELYHPDHIEIRATIEEEVWLFGNPGRFQQVLINILNNARDAIKTMKQPQIQVELQKRNQHIEIIIQDNGPGIAPDIRQKIFDPFFTTKEVNEGTGIGLSIVHSILEEHKGKIQLDDQVKIGCRFIIELPISQKEISTQEVSTPNNKLMSTTQGTVMVVDDEEDIRIILNDILREQGLDVIIASNGQEALDLFNQKNREIDLIISDVKMPIMGGIEFAQNLKKQDYRGKLIFITGGMLNDLIELNSISDDVITKPFDFNAILQVVEKYLNSG
jgi:PAS domain S-box-containing protein